MITPKDLKTLLGPTVEEAKNIELHVDSKIKESVKGDGMEKAIYLKPNDFGPTVSTQRVMMDRYRTAGWDVRYIPDQREGDFVMMTPIFVR